FKSCLYNIPGILFMSEVFHDETIHIICVCSHTFIVFFLGHKQSKSGIEQAIKLLRTPEFTIIRSSIGKCYSYKKKSLPPQWFRDSFSLPPRNPGRQSGIIVESIGNQCERNNSRGETS